jgi:hypothetical protein
MSAGKIPSELRFKSFKNILHNILAGKSEGNKPLERPKHKWEDNVKNIT